MALQPQTKLGPYEIQSVIGAGGMGEVYRATDARLGRTVAIKTLPSHLAARPDLRERFEREARAISAVNHPNICSLYDIGREGGVDFMVMEFIEGETLERRLARRQLPLAQAIRNAIEIASALTQAHNLGITHRDLKPGNIMLTKSGVKLLDFGLAKISTNALSGTLGSLVTGQATGANLTAEGSIIGTLQYMAPEQLEGADADARTDIFAFGAVLYEMVTGQKAFQGKSQPSLISAIMSLEPPPMTGVHPLTPRTLDRMVKHCLAKDPASRWQTMHDVLLQLQQIEVDMSAGEAEASKFQRSRFSERIAWLVAVFLLLLLLSVVQWRARRPENVPGSVPASAMLSILPPEGFRFATGPRPSSPAISPNGERLALIVMGDDGQTSLWIRPLNSTKAELVPDTEDAHNPFWSPDSRFVGFFASGRLKTVEASGGPVRTLCDSGLGYTGAWSSTGIIVFNSRNSEGLFRVPSEGGVPAELTVPDYSKGGITHGDASFLPDGRHFLFADYGDYKTVIKVGRLDSSEAVPLGVEGASPVYRDGHLIFRRNPSTLMTQPFDPAQLKVSGEPQILAEQVSGFSVANYGLLAFSRDVFAKTKLVWFNRSGLQTGNLGSSAEYANPSLSPDGRRVAIAKQDGPNVDIWIMDVAQENKVRLTTDPKNDNGPVWSFDGKQIAFTSTRAGIAGVFRKSLPAGNEDLLFQFPTRQAFPADWLADGRFLVLLQGGPTGLDGYLQGSDKDQLIPIANTRAMERYFHSSRDGKFVAFVSDESGREEVYVQALAPNSTKEQVSLKGGSFPRWRRDGKELFYLRQDGALMALDIKPGASIEHQPPHLLFKTDAGGWLTGFLKEYYDVSSDGQRFLFCLPSEQLTSSYTVMLNWSSALKR